MTVINPNSISGITSITLPSGDGNVLTIHTNDGVERFRIDSSGNVKVGSAATISPDGDVFFTGVTTATTFTGAHSGSGANLTSLPAAQLSGTLPAISGANLTSLPAAQLSGTLPAISGANLTNLTAGNLTGALPAISGANLTGIAATDNVRTGILDVAGVSTFRNTMNVGAAVTISESGIEASGIGITVANINGAKIGGKKNIWINGDMAVAQRATMNGATNTSTGLQTVDRWTMNKNSGTITQEYLSLSNATTDAGPWQEGIRHAFRLTNTSAAGSGTGTYVEALYKVEAKDLALSGWNYNDANSFITLSYWARSSVAQEYPASLRAEDWGSGYYFPWNFTLAQANVWQKFVIRIHGHSSMTINNDNGTGWILWINPYQGSDYFSGSYTANDWNAAQPNKIFAGTPTTTWGTTAGATWDITGFQLEVGSEATPFETMSYYDNLQQCYRYFRLQTKTRASGKLGGATNYVVMSTTSLSPVMRTTPSVTAQYGAANKSGNVSNIDTVNITYDHVGIMANISDDNYYYYNNGWYADAEL